MTTPTQTIFHHALGLQDPWMVRDVQFDAGARRLDMMIDFPRGSRFACPSCGASCAVHDTMDKTWRHLDFFQHQALLHARVPRASCPEHGVLLVAVPWARADSGFTLLFEALVMSMVPHMALARIAALVGETDHRLWRITQYYAAAAVADRSLAGVTAVGMDETATARGHRYVTVVADLEQGRVIFATEGKDAATVAAFATHLEEHGGSVAAVTEAACDMSQAYIAGIGEHLPQAEITFDHFHLAKLVGDAVDETRREEARAGGWQQELLKGQRYTVLRNIDTQSEDQAFMARVIAMPALHLKTGKAYRMRLAFQDAMAQPGERGVAALSRWCRWAARSKLPEMVRVGQTLTSHWDGVTRFFTTGYTTAIMESINGLIQAARARARGYRNVDNLIAMIHLIAGRHDLTLHGLARLAGRA
jgi:transposase